MAPGTCPAAYSGRADVEDGHLAGCRSSEKLVTADLLGVVVADVAAPGSVDVSQMCSCDLAHLHVERRHVRPGEPVSDRGAFPAGGHEAGLLERLQVR